MRVDRPDVGAFIHAAIALVAVWLSGGESLVAFGAGLFFLAREIVTHWPEWWEPMVAVGRRTWWDWMVPLVAGHTLSILMRLWA